MAESDEWADFGGFEVSSWVFCHINNPTSPLPQLCLHKLQSLQQSQHKRLRLTLTISSPLLVQNTFGVLLKVAVAPAPVVRIFKYFEHSKSTRHSQWHHLGWWVGLLVRNANVLSNT